MINRIASFAAWLQQDLWKDSRLSLLLTLVHCLVFDTACYYIYFGNSMWSALNTAFVCISIAWPLFYLISWAKRYALWIYIALFAIDGLTAYFVWNYKLELRADTLALMYESNIEESSAFIGLPIIIWFSICVGCAYAIARHENTNNFSIKRRFRIFLFLLITGASSYQLFTHIDYRMPKQLPVGLIQESQLYFKEKARLKKMMAAKIDISDSLTKKPEDSPTVILVIGESARADHFSLNGYNKETSPELNKRNVLSYSSVISCGNQTRISVPCMLTRNTVANHDNFLKETSLISLFRAAGFSTAWYSSQRVMHKNDTVTTSIANEAQSVYFNRASYNNVRDEYLLPKVKEFTSSKTTPQMLVIHTIGSHWAYDHRYDEAHEIFKPVCHDSTQWTCSIENLTNTYDNSIIYADWFLSTIIDSLKDKNALLIYASDHGESLGEEGLFSHGQDDYRPEQRQVPLILWTSEKYKTLHADRYESAKQKLNQALSHDVIFHSMLDCAGISASVIDKTLSLCAQP